MFFFFFLINSFLNNFISSDISYWLTRRKYGHCFIRSFLKNVSHVDYVTWLRKLCEIASKTQLLCNYNYHSTTTVCSMFSTFSVTKMLLMSLHITFDEWLFSELIGTRSFVALTLQPLV